MAAVRPAQPVPRITVSRTEFSIIFLSFWSTWVRFARFELGSGLLTRFAQGMRGRRRLVAGHQPCNIGTECGAQSHGRAIAGHDVRRLFEDWFINRLIAAFTA